MKSITQKKVTGSTFPLKLQDIVINPNTTTKGFDYFSFKFLKNYVYQLFRGDVSHSDISIIQLFGVESGEVFSISPISLSDENNDCVNVNNKNMMATVIFRNATYHLMFNTFSNQYNDSVAFLVYANGLQQGSVNPSLLIDELERCSLQYSPYKNSILSLTEVQNQAESTIGIEILKLEKTDLSDIFVSSETEKKLNLFIDCVNKYTDVRKSLRYLFNGKPGTGKTKMIRAIVNSIQGNATVIMSNGSNVKLSKLFEFAKLFSPVVVCIDDVDLLVGNREERSQSNSLGKFLQYLDGFVESDMFILATTNDKSLVDMAASRPGRFDMIIDIQPLSPSNYLHLIESKTNSNDVISLFDETVLDVLESRKVTGAFISTLVKHLELCRMLQPKELTKENLLRSIEEIHSGFYKQPAHQEKQIGFAA